MTDEELEGARTGVAQAEVAKAKRRTKAQMLEAADRKTLLDAMPEDYAAAAAALDAAGARPPFRLASALCRYKARSPMVPNV